MPRRRSSTSPTDILLHQTQDEYKTGPESAGECDSEERPQRNAANARERARMRVLSRAFCRLKTTLPWVPPDTKLSKLDTLRLATSYIDHLTRILHGHGGGGGSGGSMTSRSEAVGGGDCSSTGPGYPTISAHFSLSWPFTFQQPTILSQSAETEISSVGDGGGYYSYGDSLIHNS